MLILLFTGFYNAIGFTGIDFGSGYTNEIEK